MPNASQLVKSLRQRYQRTSVNLQINHFTSQVNLNIHPDPDTEPIVFFNASSRLVGVSLNAAFALLTSLALRQKKVPVIHFVCQAGLSRCVLGTDRNDFSKAPPCQACIAQSRWLYSSSMVIPFTFKSDEKLINLLRGRSLERLMELEYQLPASEIKINNNISLPPVPLGRLVLPAIRWVLRRHTLQDDELTRSLYRKYILSANRVAEEFSNLLNHAIPQAVVLFNGQFFPEATARWVALQHGIRTITHEVGLQPFSAYFTTGEATAYPLHVPDDFELSVSQNDR